MSSVPVCLYVALWWTGDLSMPASCPMNTEPPQGQAGVNHGWMGNY